MPVRRYHAIIHDSARWDAYTPRAGDIVISTPPKCGTTWMQRICALLVFGSEDLDRPMAEISPWIDQTVDPLDAVVATLDAQVHRRFVKTHTPADGLPLHDEVAYVVVGRDPRDAAMSWFDHLANADIDALLTARAAAVGTDDLAALFEAAPYFPPPEDQTEHFWFWMQPHAPLEHDAAGLRYTLHHLWSYWQERRRPNVHLFHYADLWADVDREMRRLADVLGIEVPEAQWQDLVAAARLDAMRADAGRTAPNTNVDLWKDTSGFFGTGGGGRWRSLMADGDDARYEAHVAEHCEDVEFLAWLHRA